MNMKHSHNHIYKSAFIYTYAFFLILCRLSDIFGGRRASVIAVFMGLLCPLLYIFALNNDASAGHGSVMPVTYHLMFYAIMGCLVGGPSNIIISALAIDLADDPSVRYRYKVIIMYDIF